MKNFTDGYDDFEENGTSIVTYTINGVKMAEAEFAQQLREKHMKIHLKAIQQERFLI